MSDPRFSFVSNLANADEQAIRELLGGSTLRVVVTRQAAESFAGQVLTYQLATLLVRLFDRVELQGDDGARAQPGMVLLSGNFLPELRKTLRVIRPVDATDETSLAVTIVVGMPSSTDFVPPADVYIGATGWRALVSTRSPQEVQDTTNPIGALAASALGASEVFKIVFGDRIQGGRRAEEYCLSLLDYSVDRGASPVEVPDPQLPDSIALDAVLYGCGSIGCGLVLGILLTPQLNGKLVAVDTDKFDDPNLYKYALLQRADVAEHPYKAVWVQKQLATYAKARIAARAFVGTAEAYVSSLLSDYSIPLAISAVDSLDSRFEIQDTLPRKVLNAGISATTAEVSVHGFGEGSCLACMVVAERNDTWDPNPIAERLGLAPERVLDLMHANVLLEPADVAEIKANGSLSQANLGIVDSFIGKPLLALWVRAAYSEATLQVTSGARVRVTTAFVSAFAGVMLLTELIKESVAELQPYAARNSYRLDLLGIPIGGAFVEGRDETGTCLCHSSFRLMVYDEKYAPANAQGAKQAA